MQMTPIIKKVDATSVPYGPDVSRNGKFVWAAFDNDRLVCIAATAPEARRRYRKAWVENLNSPKGGQPKMLPDKVLPGA